jgi:hypothetical protein
MKPCNPPRASRHLINSKPRTVRGLRFLRLA